MVLGPQAKNSNNGKTYNRKSFSKKIIQIFTEHLSKKKKSPNRGPTGIYTGFPFSVLQAAVVSSFSLLKLLAKDRNLLPKSFITIYVRAPIA